MSHKIFTYPLVIKEAYLDTFGHVNHALYLNLFEEARWEIMNAGNFGVKHIAETGIGPTILEVKIRYMKEVFLRDQMIITTQLISYERKIARIVNKMLRNGEECCVAEIVLGLFDIKARKLIPPTPEWLAVFD